MKEQNELIKRRLEELDEIKKMGVNPYPYKFDVTAYSNQILNAYKDPDTDEEREKQKEKITSVAGRIMTKRVMGKASFCHIQDETGKYKYISAKMTSEINSILYLSCLISEIS